eukprot:6186438-Pleurochrysis_carterae.AAC.2
MVGRWNISTAAKLDGVAIARSRGLECVATCPYLLALGAECGLSVHGLTLNPARGRAAPYDRVRRTEHPLEQARYPHHCFDD